MGANAAVVAYVGIGANVARAADATPDTMAHAPLHTKSDSTVGAIRITIERAIAHLAATKGIAVIARSGDYQTAPIGHTEQPDFINACIALRTCLSPFDLLDCLQDTENHFNRVRTFKDAPRTLDLDLLFYGLARIQSDRLIVPHPRLHLRAFVLGPRAQIAPDLNVPGHGPIRALLAGVADQRIALLPPR